MGAALSEQRLLAIIETQQEIAAAELEIDAAMELVVTRARELTRADAAAVEPADGEELIYHVGNGAAEGAPLSVLSAPLHQGGRLVGEVKLYARRAEAFTEEDAATLHVLTGVIAAHIAHKRDGGRFEVVGRQSTVTELPGSREFEEWLAAELARLRRHGGRLALCMLELAQLERVEDDARTAILHAVASHLDRLRGEDRVFRTAPDQFAAVLAETDLDGAGIAMRRVSASIEADPACGGVVIWWGAAALEPDDELASIVERARVALDDAKRAVRR
jgi:GGDEF domain-containing protein